MIGVAFGGLLLALAPWATASEIPFNGALTLTQVGTAVNPEVNFLFSNLTASALPAGDTLNGAPVVLSPGGGGFVMSGPITFAGDFESAPFANSGGQISIGTAATGTLNGNISFIDIYGDTLMPGFFGVNIGLSNVVITTGSSAVIDSLVGESGEGRGTMSFSFTSGPQTLGDLLTLGLPGSNYSNPQYDSLQGTVAVPEPGTWGLMATGLFALALLSWAARSEAAVEGCNPMHPLARRISALARCPQLFAHPSSFVTSLFATNYRNHSAPEPGGAVAPHVHLEG